MVYSACRDLCKIGIIASLVLIAFTSPVLAQDFTINKFHSNIAINEDASFIVEETIAVEFHRPRHGIYREVPFKYVNELGKTTKTPTKVLSVTDGTGKNLKHTDSKRGNVLNVRIGEAKKYVDGRKTYMITYKVENAILFFDTHDELYWNVTGNYWKSPIMEASADVTLVTNSKSESSGATCYTGVYGSNKSECGFKPYENGSTFFTTRTLNPGEGLTIAFGWDKGLVTPPSGWKRFVWTVDVKENWVFLLPFVSLITMINLWNVNGRDSKVRRSIAVMYEPPKHRDSPLTPAEVGTLIDEKLHPRDISATIVGLAVKGYIKIEETRIEGLIWDSNDYHLSKTKEPDKALNSFEIELMGKIFPYTSTSIFVSDMKNKFYKNLKPLNDTLYEELVLKGYFSRDPQKTRYLYAIIGVIIAMVIPFALIFLQPYSIGKSILAGVVSGLIVIAFSRVMPAKTRDGVSAYKDILGFQEFLNRAEKDRLERTGDKDLFSKFLPYAIALGVAENWAKAFEGIYQESPEWYKSSEGFVTFHPHSFSRSIGSATSSLASAMFSSPRGSGGGGGGGGGGGSSGGGFGGGGGGSW